MSVICFNSSFGGQQSGSCPKHSGHDRKNMGKEISFAYQNQEAGGKSSSKENLDRKEAELRGSKVYDIFK